MDKSWEDVLKEADEISAKLQNTSSPDDLRIFGKKLSEISNVAEKIRLYKKNNEAILENELLLKDLELKELAEEELVKLKNDKEKLHEEIKKCLTYSDPDDKKNAIIEIRAGTGGEEAALFASELASMIFRFSDNNGYQVEIFNKNETENNGIKEIVFAVKGDGCYGNLKYESGVHRVQRIPKTESKGRVHTSAASIFVIPETTEEEFEINENEIKFETFRSSGPGGQSVNTTDSAVRLTHIPSGISVSCQDEKSQHKNRARALSILRSRLSEAEKEKKENQENLQRKSAIRTGDRSDKIRTWNFPQDRMTDHRINKNFFGIKKILEGEIDEVIEEFKKIKS